uniref:Rho GTPase-activating protein 44 n=1 Tax=Nothobranchius korthausae TaxID=1143690 RepID=A0A1A8G1H0_9TELE
MKKQFNRMRQLANQTVGRAEKTEVLSDDLLQVEKRLDLVKQVTHSTHKKLTGCLQGQQGTDTEKKSVKSPSKKLPLTILAQCMEEGAAVLGDDSLLGKMLKLCGETEEKLAQELLQFELQTEREVVEPLYVLAEVDIPNIQKQRKHLAKLVLDMDSARARYQQSSKSSSHPSTMQPGTKSESLREEMEEAANRMEICRDQLSADMYNFVAKEIDYANYFQALIETQAEYHRKSLEILHSVLPQIKAHQEAWVEKPSFGKSLEEHLNISGREIAFPIEACVTMLLECGMQEEGLFRVAPSASKLKKLKASLDCGVLDVQEYSSDPHAIAGALKSYLRELPEPLMTTELYEEWIQASNIQDMDKRLQALMAVCEKLPTDNLNNFRYLIKFLAKLSEYQDSNKMTPGNIAIVLGPNLLWTHTEPNMTEMMTTVSLQIVGIIEPIIQHADWFFPEDVEFNVSGMFVMPTPASNHNSHQDYDCSTIERKRPGSVVAPENDAARKDNSSNKHLDHTLRRGSSTLGRKQHISPAFQPPLPPVEVQVLGHGAGQAAQTPTEAQPPAPQGGSGFDTSQHSLAQSLAALAAAQQLLAQHTEELSYPKLRDSTPTPVLQRNGSGGGGSAGTTGTGSMGPSPHLMRRGTKKQAPPPPKPSNPPPSQPCSSTSSVPSSGLTQSLSPTTRPSPSHSPTSPASPTSQPSATPRRHSNNQPPIQAPSHPPPEPPTSQPAPQPGDDQPSPPATPTPPDTPPPPSTTSQDVTAPLSPQQLGSLPRPRPVPKPRNRPSIPPPPQPNTLSGDSNGICSSAYKMMDPAMPFKGSSRALVPELAVDQQPATVSPSSSSCLLHPKDYDLDTESTVL